MKFMRKCWVFRILWFGIFGFFIIFGRLRFRIYINSNFENLFFVYFEYFSEFWDFIILLFCKMWDKYFYVNYIVFFLFFIRDV